jgi:CRP/FNR family transcriptional regulator, cyclic AMP receptor protein
MPVTVLGGATAFLSMLIVFALKTLADTAFLDEFGPAFVPHFIIGEALILVITSTTYGVIIKRRKTPLADVGIICGLIAVAFFSPMAAREGGWILFAAALALVTLSGLAALAVWNGATSLVSGRRSRTFVPRAGAAATSGAVVGGFGSSGLIELSGDVDILGPVAGFLAAAMLILHVVVLGAGRRHGASRRAPTRLATRAPSRSRASISRRSRRLVWFLLAAALAESLLSAVVDYGFKAQVAGNFSREDMGAFFANFYGGVNVGILAFQLLAGGRLLHAVPLRLSLSLEPIAVALGALAWTLMPVLAFASITRGSEAVLKFGIARPAQEIALTPLRHEARQRWKVLLRGVFAQAGAAVAGVVLIATSPLLDSRVVPAAALVLAITWLVLQRLVGRRYVEALGSAIGLRHLSVSHERADLTFDRDAVARMVEMAADADADTARFGRELLTQAVHETSTLADHLTHPDPGTRQTLYELMARHPHPNLRTPLRRAVAHERDGDLIAAGLAAMAAHRDDSAIERARVLTAGVPPESTGGAAGAAWAYLAEVGALDPDPDRRRQVLEALLGVDGLRAARIFTILLEARKLAEESVDQAVTAAASAEDGSVRRQGYAAAAALGRSRGLVRLLEGIADNRPGATEALVHLSSPGLGRLMMLLHARSEPARVRARVLRGLRGSELFEVTEAAARSLLDESPRVREVAANTLLKHVRDHGAELPETLIDEALGRELDRFELYVRARPPYPADMRESRIAFRLATSSPDADTFYHDELERQTERALSRVLALLALTGNPARIYAAERELRAPEMTRRLAALDILQEFASGPRRTRLFELLELYLNPPRNPELDRARAVLEELDPWLARCGHGLSEMRQRFWALRSTLLFDQVSGEALIYVAEHVTEIHFAEGGVVVEQDQPGDSLFVVLDGTVEIVRDGDRIGELAAGGSFGELALVDERPRGATVRAVSAARMLRLHREPFHAALAEHPEIRLGLVRGLARWLREAHPVR